MLAQPIQAESAMPIGKDIPAQLNAIAFTPEHIRAALDVLATLPPHSRPDPLAQAQMLQAYVRDAKLGVDPAVPAALHARICALAAWTAAHDPDRQSDAEAVMTAAASFPLGEFESGIGFDPAGFQELVLFVEELPW